jgi:hypothetical protein
MDKLKITFGIITTENTQSHLNDIIERSEELVKLAKERAEQEEAISQSGGVFANSIRGIEGLLKKAGFGDLAQKLNALMQDPEKVKQMGNAALSFSQSASGATEQAMQIIKKFV